MSWIIRGVTAHMLGKDIGAWTLLDRAAENGNRRRLTGKPHRFKASTAIKVA